MKHQRRWYRFRKNHSKTAGLICKRCCVLVRAYSRGEYRAVSQDGLLSIIAALSYLVDPYDLIPDEVPFLGFIDDATVVAFAVRASREDLDDFMTWEMVAS